MDRKEGGSFLYAREGEAWKTDKQNIYFVLVKKTKQTNNQTNRQTNKQTNKQISGQTNKQRLQIPC